MNQDLLAETEIQKKFAEILEQHLFVYNKMDEAMKEWIKLNSMILAFDVTLKQNSGA